MTDKDKSIFRKYADFLDTNFRIPGTKITFGYDFLIGLVPGLGDVITYIMSGGLILMMVSKGASSKAVGVMLMNILADSTLGSIPIVGDIFDLFFKANKRNVDIYEDHFDKGKYQGSVWPWVIGVLLILIAIFIIMVYLIARILMWAFEMML